MRTPISRFAGALLHRRDWGRHGVHSRALASPLFTQVFAGYHTPSEHPASVDAMAWVLQNRILPGAIISHGTAAALWGIPIPWSMDQGIGLLRTQAKDPDGATPRIPSILPGRILDGPGSIPLVHCRIDPAGGSSSARGAIVHRWSAGETRHLGKLVLSSPEEVLRELGHVLAPWDHLAALEAVVGPSWPHGKIALADVGDFCARHRGRRRIRRLAGTLLVASDQVRSPGETVMRQLIAAVGLPMPTPNLPVRDPLTGSRRYLDLAWEHVRFALEYDGDGHRLTADQWRLDESRRDELASYGWTLSRCNAADLTHPLRILLRVARTLHERGVATPTPREIETRLEQILIRRPSLMLGPRRGVEEP